MTSFNVSAEYCLNTIFVTVLTEAQQVPNVRFWRRCKNHIHQPEGVENLYTHPREGAEQAVMHSGPHPSTQGLAPQVGQDTSQEEEKMKNSQRQSQTQVDGN